MRLARIMVAVGLPLALVWWLVFGRTIPPEPVAPGQVTVSTTPTAPALGEVSTEPTVPQDSMTPPSPTIAEPADPKVSRTDITTTSKQFVTGWLTVNEKRRVQILRPVTTEELLEGLALTRADKIPDLTPRGQPDVIRAGGGTVEVHQNLTGGNAIAMLLIIDSTGRHGWRVSSVRPVD